MSLKEITKDLHDRAESTKFMRAVFAGNLNPDTWIDFTYQKTLFYGAIEGAAGACRLLDDLPDIRRAFYLWDDFLKMYPKDRTRPEYNQVTKDYYNYILSISKDPDRVLAHMYTWHMGDLYGGQMIKRIIPGSHTALEFENKELLIQNLRAKLNDDTMGQEARCAFEWSIRIIEQYDNTAVGTSA